MKISLSIIILLLLFNMTLPADVEFIGDYQSHQVDGNTVIFNCAPVIISVQFCSEEIVKVAYTFVWNPLEDSSIVLVHDTWESVAFTLEEEDSTIHILSNTFDVACQKYPFRLAFHERSGNMLIRDRTEGGFGWENPKRYCYFSQDGDDHFYGLGMRAIDLDRKGWSFDAYNWHGSGDYEHPVMGINIPFVCTNSGYGLYFDNTYTGNFDFGWEDPDWWMYRADGGQVTYYLIHGPGMKQILERYTWLTGRQPLPPRWALGYLQSKYGYENENQAKAMISNMRDKGIPIDAIILDLYWFGFPGDMGRLAWNLAVWPDPARMMEEFRDYGIKTILIEEPYVRDWTSNFSEGSRGGYFGRYPAGGTYIVNMWAGPAGLIDFTNPEARQWWWSKHETFLDQGVAGWWTDLGEPEIHPGDMVHHLGSTAKVHNIMNLLWSRTLYEGYRSYSPDQRVFMVTRSGYAGMQRYGTAPWSGDVSCSFRGLTNQIPIMLGMSLSGVGYQHSDISGFGGYPSGELYTRWMQFGTFCPVTRPHGVGHPTEPYGYGSEVEAICKKYIILRYRLLPYIYTMAFKNTNTGLPLARPLVMDYPDDPAVINLGDEYLWGDELLVAPVTEEGATTKDLYLPEGEWIDYHSGELYTGGHYTVQAPLEIMPLFVKNGAIIPMGPAMDYSNQMDLDTLTLDCYPSGFSSAVIYEDDGRSFAYESGDWDTTRFTCRVFSDRTVVEIEPAEGGYSGRLAERIYIAWINRVFEEPDSVLIQGEPGLQYASAAELDGTAEGWWYDEAGDMVKAKAKNAPDQFGMFEIFGTDFRYECEGIRGDVNGDGVIDVRDIIVMANHILGILILDGDDLCRADCTGDGAVNILDALSVANIILQLIPECPGDGRCRPAVTPEVVQLMESLKPCFSPDDFSKLMALVRSQMTVPVDFMLYQNMPNPFNPETDIRYQIPSSVSRLSSFVSLKVFNILGQEVKVLVDELQQSGYYTVSWDGKDQSQCEVSSGVYFCALQAGDYKAVKKMLLLR